MKEQPVTLVDQRESPDKNVKKETIDDSAENYSDPEEGTQSQEDDYEAGEDEFEQEYREKRKAYDKLEDIKQLKESIRRVTNNTGAKTGVNAGG